MTASGNTDLDRQLIDTIVEEIGESESPSLTRLFEAIGAPAPQVFRDPEASLLEDPRLIMLYETWSEMTAMDGVPLADLLDPIELAPTLGVVMLLDVLDEGWDYRYRIYGEVIADRFGQSMLGKRTSEVPAPVNIATLFIASYRAAIKFRRPILTIHTPPLTVSVTTWRRLVLPLADEAGTVTQVLAGNIPGSWRNPA